MDGSSQTQGEGGGVQQPVPVCIQRGSDLLQGLVSDQVPDGCGQLPWNEWYYHHSRGPQKTTGWSKSLQATQTWWHLSKNPPRTGSDQIAPSLMTIFQSSLQTGNIPSNWKEAHVAHVCLFTVFSSFVHLFPSLNQKGWFLLPFFSFFFFFLSCAWPLSKWQSNQSMFFTT